MKILAVECSAGPASCAVTENDKILSQAFVNVKITHSETLMPMVEAVLKNAKLTLSDIDAFAVSAGPGSFTGIRIGIAAIKGLALPENTPTAGVSTLAAMAQSYRDTDCILCGCMDARCNQVYNALFRIKDGEITRLTEDRALLCAELEKELRENYQNEKIIVMGDGATVFHPYVTDIARKADEQRLYQTAVGVALAAKTAEFLPPQEIKPVYLRLPQAERELRQKLERKQ